MIFGQIEANGQIVLINPNGIVFGPGSIVNVGSLIASTANVSDKDFMAGRMQFLEHGRLGAGIWNHGTLSVADGGLIALVAPHVTNGGLIQARLGKVTLGAGDTFTLDLYGDGLINLALASDQPRSLLDEAGTPVTALISQTGKIQAPGGQVVLINAQTAKAVLDQVINLSGTVRADTATEQNGRIVLQGHGGSVVVSGMISAQGAQAGQSGGAIEVLGDTVHLATDSQLNASGSGGGGTIHVGGAFQGQDSSHRAQSTSVAANARLVADADHYGNGGEIVVWADGNTRYAGSISARGGWLGGDGGRVEVSGKRTLDFAGAVDAGAARGAAGSLLLDPATLDIGLAEANVINSTLRTGTSATLRADIDVNVNAMIDGRGGSPGGGLTLSAGKDINLNDFIVTNNGAVNLNAAGGTLRIAAGKGVFALSAPISVTTAGDLSTGLMNTTGPLTINSSAGNVSLDTPIDALAGPVSVSAARNVSINQPVVNLRNSSGFVANAGGDVIVNAQVDGRGGSMGGGIDLVAGGSVRFNDFVITNNGAIHVKASTGSIFTASNKGLFANGGAIDLISATDFTTGILATSGPLDLTSIGGSVTIGHGIDGTAGALTLTAGADANIDSDVLNLRSGAPLSVSTGRDINIRAQLDGRDGIAGGAVTLSAGRNVNLLESISTNEGAIRVSANTGTVSQAVGTQLRSGTASIAVSAAGDLVSGSYATTGSVDVRSIAGAVTIDAPIYDVTGATVIGAATDVNVNRLVENVRSGASLSISAGRDIYVNGQIGQDSSAITDTGAISLIAGRNINVNEDVVTRNAPLTVRGSAGTVQVAPAKQLRSGNGTLTVSAGGDLYVGNPLAAKPNPDTPYATSGTLNVASTAGTLFIEAPIAASTGPVILFGGNAVHINERVYSNDKDITITAGAGGIVMSRATITLPTGQPAPHDTTETVLSDTDARLGNVTLLARGDIDAPSVRTAGTLSITSTDGKIVGGRVLRTRIGDDDKDPESVLLHGALGIDNFDASAHHIEARSAAGSVLGAHLQAEQQLYVEAAMDVTGSLGSGSGTTELIAGRDVILSSSCCNLLWISAGRDFKVLGDVIASALKADAAYDVAIDPSEGPRFYQTWIEGSGGDIQLRNPAAMGRVESMRGLWLSAANNIDIARPVHVSDSLLGNESTLQPTTLSAGGNISMGQLETIGPVSLTSANGNVTISRAVGAPVPVTPAGFRVWSPDNLGVESLTIAAWGVGKTVSLQGARAENQIIIRAHNGWVTSGFDLTSRFDGVTVEAPLNVSHGPIQEISRLPVSEPTVPVGPPAPGPLRAGAANAPSIMGAPMPTAPSLPEIAVRSPEMIDVVTLAAPDLVGGTSGSQIASAVQSVATAAALIEGESGTAVAESVQGIADISAAEGGVLLYTGGRGLAQSVDLGRGGTFGSTPDLPADAVEDEEWRRRKHQ